jgi:hypothetical protein
MTLKFYRDYQELFTGCLFYTRFGSSLNPIISLSSLTIIDTSVSKTNFDKFGVSSIVPLFETTNTNIQYGDYDSVDFTYNSTFTFIIMYKFLTDNGIGISGLISKCLDVAPTWQGYYGGISRTIISFELSSNQNGGVYDSITTSNPIMDTNWHILTFVKNGTSNYTVYFDGFPLVITEEYNGLGTNSIANSYALKFGGCRSLEGTDSRLIDTCMIFNTAKSSAEIMVLSKLLHQKYLYPIQNGKRGVY